MTGSRTTSGGRAVAHDAAGDRSTKDRVEDLLGWMTLAEKVGQMTQVDRRHLVDDADIADRCLGSLLSGGDSAPVPNTPESWADAVDRYQSIARTTRLGIPLLFGVDAVHGHGLVHGATIFPHNVGLGATRDPELARRIGAVTATEMAATGARWTFAPCVAVARDERWGRTYESFGEHPEIARQMTSLVTGLQGDGRGESPRVLATAKHWVGDGGTTGGVDAGDTHVSEAELRELHIAPYVEALRRGVGAVMVSFSSWNGDKLHGHRYLVTDVLKQDLGFEGIVVSDWDGIDDLAGGYGNRVRTAVNAGIDMVMVPRDYPRFLRTVAQEVEDGRIPVGRIDDAVRRILTKKVELGLFEDPFADRSLLDSIGSDEHRAVAREAVRKSLVLLKNDGGLLPLAKEVGTIAVVGRTADDVGRQCGGWTMGWQGRTGDITPGTTILEAVRAAVSASTEVTFDAEAADIDASYDVVVAALGESPYAEGEGDRPEGLRLDASDRKLLDRVARTGVPTVVVLIAGRPLVVTDELPKMQALVAAWLPGTEGDGVADVLFGDYDFVGALPHSWPRDDESLPVNAGDERADPLWPYGFGLRHS